MSYTVALRKIETGEVRERVYDFPHCHDWDEGQEYWWTEGNFACDCNRFLEFERAGDHEPVIEPSCSDGLYELVYVIRADGSRIAIEKSD